MTYSQAILLAATHWGQQWYSQASIRYISSDRGYRVCPLPPVAPTQRH